MRDDLKYDTKMYKGELELSVKLHYQIHDLGHTGERSLYPAGRGQKCKNACSIPY